MMFFWSAISNEFKSKAIELISTQLWNYLKDKFPGSITDIRSLHDAHNWNNSACLEVESAIAWRSVCVPLDDKHFGKKKMKADYGIKYEDESNKGL